MFITTHKSWFCICLPLQFCAVLYTRNQWSINFVLTLKIFCFLVCNSYLFQILKKIICSSLTEQSYCFLLKHRKLRIWRYESGNSSETVLWFFLKKIKCYICDSGLNSQVTISLAVLLFLLWNYFVTATIWVCS